MNLAALLSASLRQAKADLRPTILGIGFFSFILTPAIFILLAKVIDAPTSGAIDVAFGDVLIAGTVSAMATLVIIQIVSEMYTERINGTFLRVKTLPHGIASWMIGKSISAGALVFLQTAVILVVAPFTIDGFNPSVAQILLCLALSVLAIAASSPLAFILGIFARGSWTTIILYMVGIGLFFISSAIIPLGMFPDWLASVAKVLPGYASAYLARSILCDDAVRLAFGDQLGMEVVAFGILVAWLVIGSVVAAAGIKRAFRKETMGALLGTQQKLQSQLGI